MSDTLEIALAEARARQDLPSPYQRRRLRRKAGLTQRDIAEAIGVRRVTITAYEAGRRTPQGETLAQYLAVLERLTDANAVPNEDTPPVGADGRVRKDRKRRSRC
jgi:transcriptional regulator with XRE-family HTH domain